VVSHSRLALDSILSIQKCFANTAIACPIVYLDLFRLSCNGTDSKFTSRSKKDTPLFCVLRFKCLEPPHNEQHALRILVNSQPSQNSPAMISTALESLLFNPSQIYPLVARISRGITSGKLDSLVISLSGIALRDCRSPSFNSIHIGKLPNEICQPITPYLWPREAASLDFTATR
jgi:hypothetical protein